MHPTSVEAERAFSSLGLFTTKIRNSSNDGTFDFFKANYKMFSVIFILSKCNIKQLNTFMLM